MTMYVGKGLSQPFVNLQLVRLGGLTARPTGAKSGLLGSTGVLNDNVKLCGFEIVILD